MKINIVSKDETCLIYRYLLENSIEKILNTLEESASDITWVIFDENKYNNKFGFFRPLLGYKYGFCIYENSEIWISTKAIQESNVYTFTDRLKDFNKSLTYKEKAPNKLLQVILDELAHIRTNKDHGHEEYEKKLNTYYERFRYIRLSK